jgi:hypothetical protein
MMNKNATRYYSNKQEKHVAKAIGGRKTANSGATMFQKGDVVANDWLIECKTCLTEKQSFSIKREWIDKNEEEAFAMGKHHSAVCFNFGETHHTQNFYIISEEEFKRLVELED